MPPSVPRRTTVIGRFSTERPMTTSVSTCELVEPVEAVELDRDPRRSPDRWSSWSDPPAARGPGGDRSSVAATGSTANGERVTAVSGSFSAQPVSCQQRQRTAAAVATVRIRTSSGSRIGRAAATSSLATRVGIEQQRHRPRDPPCRRDMEVLVGPVGVAVGADDAGDHELGVGEALAEHSHERDRATLAELA